jgi:hypothetical protein
MKKMSAIHNKKMFAAGYVILIALFVISCATPLPQTVAENIPEDIFGVVGFSDKPEASALLHEMELKWSVRTLYWNNIENKKGIFNFSGFDEAIDMANNEGIKIIGILGYETNWLFPEGKSKKYISPENIPHFLRYVEETVRHFQGRIDVWQIWNEPNHIFWKGPNKDFYELSRLTAEKIKETDPSAYIIGGALMRAPKGFTKGMYKAGATQNLDGISFHPYGLNPWESMRVFDKFFRVLSQINFSGSVWITEMGYPTAGWYPHKTSLEKLPSFVVKTAVGAAIRGARVFVWYELFDFRNKGEEDNKWNSEDYFGLVYPNFDRKDGAWAYTICARYLAGSRYAAELPVQENIPRGILAFCFLEGESGYNTLILWNDRSRTKKIKFELPVPALIHDIRSGKNSPLPEETVLEVGNQPLIITWKGTDIPRLSIGK